MELIVTDLCCARGDVALLSGVSFRVPAGATLILRGPNGIGKTTLLRTIAGLQPPTGGAIWVPPDALAYAGHADGVKAMLTVAENLAFWAAVHGRTDTSAAQDAMGLAGLADRLARNLSAGQKRRLGLARLLVSGRPVWLLDEPTVSLDAGSVALFGAALRAHLGQGGAAVIATHIDLGLPEAAMLDLSAFRAATPAKGSFDEAFA